MYLIKIKTKRGHCTPDWAPWSHILGNTARSTPLHTLSRDQTTKKRMSDAKNGFQAGVVRCCQPWPRPAHSLPLHINTTPRDRHTSTWRFITYYLCLASAVSSLL